VPVHDDKKLFEFITLEGAQAGLSWLTILKRRPGYKNAFSNFDVEKIAKFTPEKMQGHLLKSRKNSDLLINTPGVLLMENKK
jgi:DNA-3-methyladenine glycosylase I